MVESQEFKYIYRCTYIEYILTKIVFQVTLTILEINKDKLLKCTEDGQAIQVLNDYLEGIYNEEAMALSTEPRTAEKVSFNTWNALNCT